MTRNIWPRAVLTAALRGPGKALLAASATGWIVMIWLLTGDRLSHSAHSPTHLAALWFAMILAMAPLLLLREIGHLWRTSLRRLRHLTIAWFVGGYVGMWLLVGAAVIMLLSWVNVSFERIVLAIMAAALWHCSPARQRCLNACHRVPALRVFGVTAQWDSLRYGVSSGCYCVATCGLVMFLVLLVKQHHLVAMGVATAAITIERHLPARRAEWRLPLLRSRSPEWPGARGIRSPWPGSSRNVSGSHRHQRAC